MGVAHECDPLSEVIYMESKKLNKEQLEKVIDVLELSEKANIALWVMDPEEHLWSSAVDFSCTCSSCISKLLLFLEELRGIVMGFHYKKRKGNKKNLSYIG